MLTYVWLSTVAQVSQYVLAGRPLLKEPVQGLDHGRTVRQTPDMAPSRTEQVYSRRKHANHFVRMASPELGDQADSFAAGAESDEGE